MHYLEETLQISVATLSNLEAFVALATERLIPLYRRIGAAPVIAYFSNADSLFRVTQILEIEGYKALHDLSTARQRDDAWAAIDRDLRVLVSERSLRLLTSPDLTFTETLHAAIKQSKDTPLGTYTRAELSIDPEYWSEFAMRQKQAVQAGLPIVAFLRSATGKQDQVVDLWKGDIQAAGYQEQAYYDQLGMTAEWWQWIRRVGPEERMYPVFMLPYSPLR